MPALSPVLATPADATLPYSPAVLASGPVRTLYISGQVGIDASGQVPADFEGQVRAAFANLEAVLAAAGMGLGDLAKVTAYLTDPDDYAGYGALRTELLKGHKPASTLVIAAALARPEWRIEIEAVAVAAA
ncbi:RidA family protein [Xanthobacter aminoxidans]|uniref:RidA family protein n=1 Tax=Xanthobacter aminoxidans TaxID=186280 RepID=UPI0037289A8B